MSNFFKLNENQTTVHREVIAGLTTFFAMSYIIFVNPAILGTTGMPTQAVFLATIISSVVSTLIMGIYANIPYALAPGMGLNAFFAFTVCFSLGFKWQEALAMVFLCGLFNIFITVTKIRKMLIEGIPLSIQHALGGGIGVFVAYIGLKNANLLHFQADGSSILAINGSAYDPTQTVEGVQAVSMGGGIIPSIAMFNSTGVILALIGLLVTIILVLKKVTGGILIGIIITTLAGIPLGVVDVSAVNWSANSLGSAFSELGTTFMAAFGSEGFGHLFSDINRIPLVLLTIFAFSLTDTFDTIGTFIGTGRRTGIFTEEDEEAVHDATGLSTKMERGLFADAIGTTLGALIGSSNITTFVESSAGIAAGGRTGLTSVVTAGAFIVSAIFAPVIGIVPAEATAPALVVVGIMMMSSFKDIDWYDFEEAVPAFFASIFMGLCYSISYGIAAGFFFYCLTKVINGKAREVHPIVWITTILFLINFIVLAII
ncbi:NCS2 family permease [Atopobacter phocae]|uniref:NCS2 family permease n=1 Tax=Atopobacter phocae TaxID=136492 RepID=UPI00046F0371|nr:NCS2 family permease [Atopobacter phocae]